MAARIRTVAPGSVSIAAAIESGVPVMAARIRTVAPGSVSIAAAIESGVPVMAARIRTVAPGAVTIAADIESGVPVDGSPHPHHRPHPKRLDHRHLHHPPLKPS